MSEQAPARCPRCGSGTVTRHASSPAPGVWEVFGCTTCLYAWRTTEPAENTDPAKYPDDFRLDPATIPALAVQPPVPPLVAPADGEADGPPAGA